MSGDRVLLPAPVLAGDSRIVDATPADAEVPIAEQQRERGQGREKERRHRHTAHEWDDVKDAFEELYSQLDASLEVVKEAMKRDYGFEASIRQYKAKIQEWGMEKHMKARDMQILLAKRDQRTRDRGIRTAFVFNDVDLEEDRINLFGKRRLGKSGDYVSPSTTTPAGVNYYTPLSIIDAESPHVDVDTDDAFILQNAHHYRKVASITTVEALHDRTQTIARDDAASLAHPHQAAKQGVACRGRFSVGDRATKTLWQAHNFAVDFAKIMLEPAATGGVTQKQWSTDPLVPQFWVSPQAPEGPGHPKVQRLLDCVKRTVLCRRLLAVGRQDSSRWLGDWRLMNESEVLNVETAGRLTFGNPSLPYLEMEIVTLWAKFDKSTAKTNSNLLRVCICVDLDQQRQDCNFCHSACLVLDYMDPEGAVKLNIPLFRYDENTPRWDQFQDTITTHKTTIRSTWRDVNYIYQGMSHIRVDCKRHKSTKANGVICVLSDPEEDSEEEGWDAEGKPADTLFEPFPPPETSWVCSDDHSLWAPEEWYSEEDPLISDEEGFEPFPAD